MSWLARLFGKKPGFESWWIITGVTFSERRMAAIMHALSDLFVDMQLSREEEIAALMYLAGGVMATERQKLPQVAEAFPKAILELLGPLTPQIDISPFAGRLGWIRENPVVLPTSDPGHWRRWFESIEEKLGLLYLEHMRRVRTLNVLAVDYTGAIAYMLAQIVHRIWLQGNPDEAINVIEGLPGMMSIHEKQAAGESQENDPKITG